MPETLGSLNLKIIRTQRRLNVLQKQKQLSELYPDCAIRLQEEEFTLRLRMSYWLQERRSLCLEQLNNIPVAITTEWESIYAE